MLCLSFMTQIGYSEVSYRQSIPVKPKSPVVSVPLKHLPAGQSACIRSVTGHPDHVHRLEELGLRSGTKIEMFRQGNPCIVRLACSKVCLRTDDLLHVLVEPAVT
jgi:ferrous iron transport protein A